MIDKNIYLSKSNGNKLYVNVLETKKDAPNVIYIMTPIGTVKDFKDYYTPLAGNGCNVFALDLSGKGKSEGELQDFSMDSIVEDVDTLVDYILEEYSEDIHVFGATGTGGILAQAYLTSNSTQANIVKSFTQTGIAIHGDMSIMGSSTVYKMLHKIVPLITKVSPKLTIKFKVPKYKGVNAEKEAAWYEQFQKEHPGALDMDIAFVKTLLHIFYSPKSPIIKKVNCPTLVIIPQHDRFFYPSYVKKYYDSLSSPKKFHSMNDSHLCFVWNSDEICREVGEWVEENSKVSVV